MNTLFIYGGGDEGKKVANLAIGLNQYGQIIFVDDDPSRSVFPGMEVISFEDAMRIKTSDSEFIVAVGEPVIRELMYRKITEKGSNIATLTYPGYFQSIGVQIGKGTTIHCGALLQHEVTISENCMINMYVTLGHNVVVGKNSVVSTGAIVGGNTTIGENTYIGSGAVIRDGIRIGAHSIVGMGAVVTKSVEDNVVVVGNPAKFLRENTQRKVFK